VYTTVRDQAAGAWFRRLFTTDGAARVSRNVVLLGLTSLFTDISSEMLTAVLPLYFMLELRMTPLQFGLIDGLYQGTSAIVRVAAGVISDAGTRHKAVASVGYGVSAVCKIGLIAVGSSWGAITGLLMADRLGKGIRTAPRDALISLSSDPARLGEAFGVHRALDTVGAIIGPLVAFGILMMAPGDYRTVFIISFLMAVIGLAIIVLLVENRRSATSSTAAVRPSFMDVIGPGQGGRVIAAGGLLGAMTATDALIYLLVQRKGALTPTLFPLLFVGTAVAYFLLALPFGRLADRMGRHRLFIAGHAAVIAIYLLLLSPWFPPILVIVVVALLGAYYAATDGVLSALATTRFAAPQLATGLSVVATVAALARLAAAAFFGALWTWWQAPGALTSFAFGLALAIALAAWLLRVDRQWDAPAAAEEP
jgi:MFS family permease